MAVKNYAGSCHCGDVKFEADIDLEAGTGKCNCSICKKSRAWGVNIKPAQFRLLTSRDKLSDYQFGSMQGHNMFCKRCGVRTFSEGDVPEIGGAFVSINIATLDNISDEALAALPVSFANGRDNDWMHAPKVTAFL
jgi:hypothetical protein